MLDILGQSCECLGSVNLMLNWSAVKDKGNGFKRRKEKIRSRTLGGRFLVKSLSVNRSV